MKKTVRISFEGKTYDVEVEVLDSAVSPLPPLPLLLQLPPLPVAPK